jgi:thiol:disulfide interchange protein DsbA
MAQLEKQGNLSAILRPGRYDESDDKIEVVFFSWYGCGTCRQTDRIVDRFVETQADDVRTVKLPATFPGNEVWTSHAKLFAVLDELGREKELRTAVFETVQVGASATGHGGPVGLVSRGSQEAFAVSQGVAKADFNAAYDGQAAADKLARIGQFVDNADFDSVPAMVVNGRYVITYFNGPGYYQLAQNLIDQERARLAAEKK